MSVDIEDIKKVNSRIAKLNKQSSDARARRNVMAEEIVKKVHELKKLHGVDLVKYANEGAESGNFSKLGRQVAKLSESESQKLAEHMKVAQGVMDAYEAKDYATMRKLMGVTEEEESESAPEDEESVSEELAVEDDEEGDILSIDDIKIPDDLSVDDDAPVYEPMDEVIESLGDDEDDQVEVVAKSLVSDSLNLDLDLDLDDEEDDDDIPVLKKKPVAKKNVESFSMGSLVAPKFNPGK